MRYVNFQKHGIRLCFATVVFILLFSLHACNKFSNSENELSSASIEDRSEVETFIEYYLDDVSVSNIEIDTTVDQWIFYTVPPSSSPLYQTLQVRKYSTRNKFELFGDIAGVNLRKQLAIADRLRFVADSAGLISTVADESQIPKWYLTYSQSLTSNLIGGAEDRFLGTELRKDNSEAHNCKSWGEANFLPGIISFNPAMTVWNNQTSGVRNVDVYGAFHMWDKWFYRKYLGVLSGININVVPLCGTVADRRTSSAIRYGL